MLIVYLLERCQFKGTNLLSKCRKSYIKYDVTSDRCLFQRKILLRYRSLAHPRIMIRDTSSTPQTIMTKNWMLKSDKIHSNLARQRQQSKDEALINGRRCTWSNFESVLSVSLELQKKGIACSEIKKNLYLFSVCKNQQRMLIIEIIATSTVRWFKHFCCNLLIIIFNRPFVS